MKFSVVIPAYNEAHYVRAAIQALQKQTIPRNEFEIIVVDNGSGDATSETARAAHADKVVREERKGTNLARQKGFLESTGEIIAFLDADCEPPPHWLAHIEKRLSEKGVVAVSGPYDYGFTGWKKTLAEIYTHHVIRYLEKFLPLIFRKKAGEIIGGNFAAPRWAIEKIGGLPPLTFFGDDSAIAMRLSRQAGRVVWDTTLIVKGSARRFEKEGLFRLTTRYAWHYFKQYFSRENAA